MAMTFGDHVKQLIEKFPQCEDHTAVSMTWQAALLVYNDHPWSFCVKEGRIATEARYATGTVALNPDSSLVTLTGGAWNPAWTFRRFTSGNGLCESDITVNTSLTGTLAFSWIGEAETAAAYEIFRDTYDLPVDCNYGRDFFVLDPARNCALRLKDLSVFMRAKLRVISGYPEWVTRVAVNGSTGAPMLRFGPAPPTTATAYPIIYYAAPTKPATRNNPITPLIPAAFEDLIWRRARWLYAEEKGKNRRERDDLRAIYWDRHFSAVKQCDGGAEVERFIATAYPTVAEDWRCWYSNYVLGG